MSQDYTKQMEKYLIKSLDWIKSNLQLFLTVAGTLIFVPLFSLFVVGRYRAGAERADEKFSVAQGMHSQGMVDQSVGVLNEVITKYPRTQSAYQSRLLLSEIQLGREDYHSAIENARIVFNRGKPTTLRPFGLMILINGLIEKGALGEALAKCNLFIEKYPDHFLTPRAYILLVDVYVKQLMHAEANTMVEKIVTLYPDSPWVELARLRIKK